MPKETLIEREALSVTPKGHSAQPRYRCHTAVFSTGERFPVLLYAMTYEPVSLVTRYIIDERRENKQSSTIARDVRVLKWFYEWCDRTKISIDTKLRTGDLLTAAEVTSFCRYLRTKRSPVLAGSIDFDDASQKSSVILSPETFNSYIRVIQDFLLWAAYEFIPTATPATAIRDTLSNAVERLKRSFRSNEKAGRSIPHRCGLSSSEIDVIREVMKPDWPDNPFKRTVRFRNWLIFELMLATGIRRGELLKLKLEHLPVGGKTTLSIVRSPDDVTDPRRYEPQVKTRIREIPVHKTIARMLWRYVQRDRHVKDKAQTYLFAGTRREPLSLGSVNWIFSSIVTTRLPELYGRFSPHIMRHTYNENLVEVADSMGFTQQQVKELQCYLNGWSDSSEMPTRYTRRKIEERAMEIAAKYQSQLYDF
jgi:integrase